MDWIYNGINEKWPFHYLWSTKKADVKVETVIQPGQFTAVLEPWEQYIITTQSLLIWEKPNRSAVALVLINIIFWLIVWSEPKVYFVVSSVGLAVFLHQQWVHCIWPEIRIPLKPGERIPHYTDEWLHLNPSVMSAPEVGVMIDTWYSYLRHLLETCIQIRRHRPTLFCICSSTLFCLLLVGGQLVSGTVLVYLLMMTAMLLPGAHQYLLPALAGFTGRCWTAVKQHKFWDRFTWGGGKGEMSEGDSSPDDLSEFLPESGTEEAVAALAVPLTAADSPALVAALSEHETYEANYTKSRTDQLGSFAGVHSLQDSPYGSLTPHIPTNAELPSVSDSSDDEEFIQGLAFNSSRSVQSMQQMPAYSEQYGSGFNQANDSLNFYGRESLSLDQVDHQLPPIASGIQNISLADMQSLASTLLENPAGGRMAGALLSAYGMGNTLLASVVNNVTQQVAATGASTANEDRVDKRGGSLPRALSGGDEDRAAAQLPARRRKVVYEVEEAEEESDEEGRDNPNDEDFEIISDEEFLD